MIIKPGDLVNLKIEDELWLCPYEVRMRRTLDKVWGTTDEISSSELLLVVEDVRDLGDYNATELCVAVPGGPVAWVWENDVMKADL